MLANKKRYRPCDIGHGSPTLFVSCAHFSVNVGHWLPASVMACAHNSFTVESGLYALFRKISSWSERISKETLVVVCTHHSNDINSGLRASTKQHRRNTGYNSKGLHISIIMCVHRPGYTFVVCMHWQGDFGQRESSSTKLFMHLTWFVCIWKATLHNNMLHHPRKCMHNPWS